MVKEQGFRNMSSSELQKAYNDAILSPWAKQSEAMPLLVREANGVYLTLDDERRVLDMKSQLFNANLGHNHEGMIAALMRAAKKGTILSPETFCAERLELALALKRIAPRDERRRLAKAFFTLGGAEANENAIKIARMVTGRHKIITRYRSYHGATLAMINFSGDYRRIPVDNAISGVVRFPDPYPRGSGQHIDTVRLLEEIIEIEGPETIAAVLLEGITGANGVFIPPEDYWPRIRALCDQHGIALIADEVFSGFYRTGKWFGIDHFGVVPDIMTMAKGLTAGYAPLGAVMVSEEIASRFDDEVLWCGLTQYGHPLCCATASAAIAIYETDDIGGNVRARGQELAEALDALKRDHETIAEVRSIGLMAAIELKRSARDRRPLVPYRATGGDLEPARILTSLLKDEGISTAVRFATILLAPPLIIGEADLRHGLLGIDRALKNFYHQNAFN